MFAEERHRLIVEQISATGKVTVAQLSQRFDITRETVRRDLAQLESENLLRRVHGGAVSVMDASLREESFTERTTLHAEAKELIARRALELIPAPEASIILDAGTTTETLATLMASTITTPGILAITHALPVAAALVPSSAITLDLIGGRLRGITGAAAGARTVAHYATYRADIAFIGTNGLHPQFGLSTPDPVEAAVKTAVVAAARRVVLLADASKFELETLVSFAALQDIDTLVTDRHPGAELSRALEEAEIEVIVA